jgi:hypothetical protein
MYCTILYKYCKDFSPLQVKNKPCERDMMNVRLFPVCMSADNTSVPTYIPISLLVGLSLHPSRCYIPQSQFWSQTYEKRIKKTRKNKEKEKKRKWKRKIDVQRVKHTKEHISGGGKNDHFRSGNVIGDGFHTDI